MKPRALAFVSALATILSGFTLAITQNVASNKFIETLAIILAISLVVFIVSVILTMIESLKS